MSTKPDTRPRAYLGARVRIVHCPTNSDLYGLVVGTAVHETDYRDGLLCRSCWLVALDGGGEPLEDSGLHISIVLVHDDNLEIQPPTVTP